jgi:hypothetical protein
MKPIGLVALGLSVALTTPAPTLAEEISRVAELRDGAFVTTTLSFSTSGAFKASLGAEKSSALN